jgi:hypothetical protein
MIAHPSDTAAQILRNQWEMTRRVPTSTRLILALELTQLGRKLILADLHHKFPEADEQEIRRRFIARLMPRGEVIRVYGFDPLQHSF